MGPPEASHRSHDGAAREAAAAVAMVAQFESGGPKWIRTTDLTVISRAL